MRFRTRLIAAIVVTVITLAAPLSSFAWIHTGHEAIADIAESQLTPEALAQVKRLLATENKEHLWEVASWADVVRHQHPVGDPAHSQRLPLNRSKKMDDATQCPTHYCAVAGIQDYTKILADKSQPMEKRIVALKYVVHLVGDLHEPMHATEHTGVTLPVLYHGKETQLHHLWDMDIMVAKSRRHDELAAMLMANPKRSSYFYGGTAADWALESRNLARDVIYVNGMPVESKVPVPVADDYADKMWPVVQQRLTQAGIRLGALLNRALK